jgi:hypothetical protein
MLFSTITFAQPANKDIDSADYISTVTVNLMDNPNDYTGSPYFNEDFLKGSIIKHGKIVALNQDLRYNVTKEIFEIKNASTSESNIVNTVIRDKDIEMKIGEVSFEYISSSQNGLRGYFIPLFKGEKNLLFKKITKKYIPSQKAVNSMASDIAALYKEKEILYLVNDKGVFSELPNSKGGKIKAFGELKKAVKTYVKENKLNLNKENDLIQVVAHIDTL